MSKLPCNGHVTLKPSGDSFSPPEWVVFLSEPRPGGLEVRANLLRAAFRVLWKCINRTGQTLRDVTHMFLKSDFTASFLGLLEGAQVNKPGAHLGHELRNHKLAILANSC